MTPCPSLHPVKCTGALKVSERSHDVPDVVRPGVPWNAKPLAVCCDKCGKRWTAEQLRLEYIDIQTID